MAPRSLLLGPLSLLALLALPATAALARPSGPAASTPPGSAQRQAPPLPDLTEIPGVRALTTRLIARPRPRRALAAAGLSTAAARALRTEARARVDRYEILRYVPQTDEYVLRVPSRDAVAPAIAELLQSGAFEYVEPDWLLAPASVQVQGPPRGSRSVVPQSGTCPDDPMFPAQWHHARMDSCLGWRTQTGGPSVAVGLCDTGILTTHEDLQLHRLEAYNAVDQLWESQGGQIGPVFYHGTRTTGTVAANGNNAVGVAGVGWNLSHRMLRVSNLSDGSAYLSDIQHGARTSAEAGDRVVNVSYHGASSASNSTTAAYVASLGSLLLWSAGNTSSNYAVPDRDSDLLIVVSATDQSDNLASFSSYGDFVDLCAPGVSILTTDSGFNSDYASPNGTSYACPLTSGVCALIWSERPGLSPTDVERALKLSAEDLGAPGIDSIFGYGRINLDRALAFDPTAVPVADFAGQPSSGASPLTVAFRDLSTGVPTSWSWDFGDGATSTLQNPSHTYVTPGSYTVSLSVANALGADSRVQVDYILNDVIPPVADFTGTPTAGLSPLSVAFTDQSTGGTTTSWMWDFGDGATSALPNPTHVYTSSGFYTVSLTVSNVYGSDTRVRTNYVAVDLIPPVANFSATPTSGASPLVVSFTDLSTSGGAPTSWTWYFGDGGSSTAQNPSHTYTAAGTYTVSLTVSNAYGSDILVRSGYITILPGPPIVANFVGVPTSGPAPLQVSFTDLSVGNIVQWAWDFGDGGTSTVQNPVHVYTTPGAYNVNLTVTNPQGKDGCLEITDYVTVQ